MEMRRVTDVVLGWVGLQRKTPMKRTELKRATKPMKRSNPKRAKADRRAAKPRAAFRDEFPWCWFCEEAAATDVHEMASGVGNRAKAVQERFTWAAACNDCNCHRLTDKSEWPLARQLAVKWINDRASFDRVAFNRLRGRADNAISWAEVIYWICRHLDGKEYRGRF